MAGVSCSAPSLKIGFAAALTGRYSVPGVASRDGALLGVEELRTQGRSIDFRVENDQNDPRRAVDIDRELAGAGYSVIIGHDTSEVCLAVLPCAEELGFLLVSPTANASVLAGRDDGFFMLLPDARSEGGILGVQIVREGKARRALAVFDPLNETFCRDFLEGFAEPFVKAGGVIVGEESLTQGSGFELSVLARRLVSRNPDLVLIAAGVLDSALLSQHLRIAGFTGRLVLSDWALEPEFIELGGRAVEGALFAYPFDERDEAPRFQAFLAAFRRRYGREPNYSAYLGYEAVRIIAAAAEKAGGQRPEKLKEAILGGDFEGLQGEIRFDAGGDALRSFKILEIRNGRYGVLR